MFHHGNFHQAPLAAALDGLRLALLSSAQLGQTRLGALMDPHRTGLTPFLADGPAGSNGLMITEYTAASALAALRAAATPVTGRQRGAVARRRGARELRPAGRPANHGRDRGLPHRRCGRAGRGGSRAAPGRPGRRPRPRCSPRFGAVAAALPAETADRPLEDDLAIAIALVDSLGEFSRAESTQ